MVSLVTGSAKNLGKEIIIEFAKNNYDVVINYKTSEKEANELAEYVINNYHVKALAIKCDITKEEDIKEMINKIITELGSIDVLVNNAAIELNIDINTKNIESCHKVLDVNLVGTFLVSKYASKYISKN